MRRLSHRTAPFVALAAILLAGAALWARAAVRRVPRWVVWQQQELAADLDGDGRPERVTLAGRRLRVCDGAGATLYESEPTWYVSQVQAAEIDTGAGSELALLVWRQGNYGSSRPFWDSTADARMTEHLYVLGMSAGKIVPVWMGHELGAEVAHIAQAEPGVLELVTTDGETSRWRWETWGFVRDG